MDHVKLSTSSRWLNHGADHVQSSYTTGLFIEHVPKLGEVGPQVHHIGGHPFVSVSPVFTVVKRISKHER